MAATEEINKAQINVTITDIGKLKEAAPSHLIPDVRRAAIVPTEDGIFLVFSNEKLAARIVANFGLKPGEEPRNTEDQVFYGLKVEYTVVEGQTHSAKYDKRTNKSESSVFKGPNFGKQTKMEQMGHGVLLTGDGAKPDLWNKAFGCNTFSNEKAFGAALQEYSAFRG